MPNGEELNLKANMGYKPNGNNGYAQVQDQLEPVTMPSDTKHKRQRRIEDWFPN